MNCINCGCELTEGIRFCPKCGNALDKEEKCKFYSKEQIDKAVEEDNTEILWNAIDANFVYAEYKYEEYIFSKLNTLKKMSGKTSFEEIMSEISAHEKDGSLFARYLRAYAQFIVYDPNSDYIQVRDKNIAAKACEELKQLFETIQPSASFRAAEFYLEGRYDFETNVEKGFRALKRSADAGHPLAMYRLSEIYHYGGIEGVKKSEKKKNKYRELAEFFGVDELSLSKTGTIEQIMKIYFSDDFCVQQEEKDNDTEDPQQAIQHCLELIEQVKKEKDERIEKAIKDVEASRNKRTSAPKTVEKNAEQDTLVEEIKKQEFLDIDPTEGFFDYEKELEIMKNEYSFPDGIIPDSVIDNIISKFGNRPIKGNQRYSAEDIPEPDMSLPKYAECQVPMETILSTDSASSTMPIENKEALKTPNWPNVPARTGQLVIGSTEVQEPNTAPKNDTANQAVEIQKPLPTIPANQPTVEAQSVNIRPQNFVSTSQPMPQANVNMQQSNFAQPIKDTQNPLPQQNMTGAQQPYDIPQGENTLYSMPPNNTAISPQSTVQPNQTGNKTSVGTVIRWIITVILGFLGLSLFTADIPSGLLGTLSALAMCPKVLNKIPAPISVIGSIILMFIALLI